MTAPLKNPKDSAASNKAPLSLVPVTAIALEATAFANGRFKYGQVNWRGAGVSAMVYADAALRHLYAWINGERVDPDDLVHNLAAVRACCGIIIDADAAGTLIDDRPRAIDVRPTYAAAMKQMEHLRELHKDRNPIHCYIDGDRKDKPEVDPERVTASEVRARQDEFVAGTLAAPSRRQCNHAWVLAGASQNGMARYVCRHCEDTQWRRVEGHGA